MDDSKLLVFRAGGHDYGVPLSAVSAVIGRINSLEPSPAAAVPKLSLTGGNRAGQTAILLNIGSIQLFILVDRVIKVTSAADAVAHTPGTAVGAFRLYRFPAARRPIVPSDNPAWHRG